MKKHPNPWTIAPLVPGDWFWAGVNGPLGRVVAIEVAHVLYQPLLKNGVLSEETKVRPIWRIVATPPFDRIPLAYRRDVRDIGRWGTERTGATTH